LIGFMLQARELWLEHNGHRPASPCSVGLKSARVIRRKTRGHHSRRTSRVRKAPSPRKNGSSNVFLQNRRPEFVETKKLKDPLAVEVEYAQIVGFMKIVFDHLKMPAVTRLGERERDLEGNKLANSPGFKRVEEIRVVQGFVRREDQQGPARGE